MLFANRIKQLREERELLQRHLAAALEIDTPMYSKIERGDRQAKREQAVKLAELFEIDCEELLSLWLADRVIAIVAEEKDIAYRVLNVVKEDLIKK